MALRVAAAPRGHPAPGRSLPPAPGAAAERERIAALLRFSSAAQGAFVCSNCERVWRTLRELSLPGAPTQFARVSAGHLLSAAEAGALGACTQRRGIRGEKWNPSAPWPLVHHRRLAPGNPRRRHDEGPGGATSAAALPILRARAQDAPRPLCRLVAFSVMPRSACAAVPREQPAGWSTLRR